MRRPMKAVLAAAAVLIPATAWAQASPGFDVDAATRAYLALLDGVPDGEGGTIDLALAKVSTREEGWRMIGATDGKPARTGWRLVAVADGRALVEFRPETGRTHQIRVHAASGLGVAVVGEPVYGRAAPRGMMLHAAKLVVPRAGKEPVVAEAPLPERFAGLS